MPYQRPSFARSGALLVIAAVVPVLVFAGVSAVGAYSQRQAEQSRQAVAEARRLSEAVDRELASTLDAAAALAESPTLDAPADLERFGEIARREQARHPLWLTVLLLDPQGRRLVNSRTPGRLGAAVEPASVRQVVSGRRPLVGAITKGPGEYGIPLRAPVIRGGAVSGVVTVVVRPDGIGAMLRASDLPKDWIVSVVDGDGKIVARSTLAASFIGHSASERALAARRQGVSGVYDGVTLEGVPTVSAFWRSPDTSWSVHIGIPRAHFEAPLRRSIAFTAAGLVASLLLAALFVALLARELRLRRRETQAAEQSHRLEALGRLTGGVAHDFNNLLMIIQGNAEILQRRVDSDAARRPLAAIREATARADRLTRELLVFARGGSGERRVLDLDRTVEDFLDPIRQAVGPGVEVVATLNAEAAAAEVDRVQFELALLNLAVNARDAMEGRGRLSIATRRTGSDRLELRVADNGPGIPPAVAARVFDPFFTTKPAGAGTGLGLTQVYSFARQSGGSVRVAPGDAGAVFVIELPLSLAPVSAETRASVPAAAEVSLRGRRVLVLDDDAEVRGVGAEHLRERGAEVVEGASAAEGLEALAREDFDLVVSDIVMPGHLDGVDLAERARDLAPETPVLLVSGYSASTTDAVDRGFRVLRKPFALAELDAVLAELLAT